MSMKNSNDIIGNQTRDPPTCSTVPQHNTYTSKNTHYVCITKNTRLVLFREKKTIYFQ